MKTKEKSEKNSSLAVLSNDGGLSRLGKTLNIDPLSKFQAQLVLSRQNIDPKGAKFATNIVQKELKTHASYQSLLCVAILNEAEIFGSHFKNTDFDIFGDEKDKVCTEKDRIKKLIFENKDRIVLGKKEEWERPLLIFYKTTATLFSDDKKDSSFDEILSELLFFPISQKTQSKMEMILLDHYINLGERCMAGVAEILLLEFGMQLERLDQDPPEYDFAFFISDFCRYFISNPLYVGEEANKKAKKAVIFFSTIFDSMKNNEDLTSFIGDNDVAEMIYNDKDFKKDLLSLFVLSDKNLLRTEKEWVSVLKEFLIKWKKDVLKQHG